MLWLCNDLTPLKKGRFPELLFGPDGVIVIKASVICETAMFRLNPRTYQPALFSDLNLLPACMGAIASDGATA